MLFVVSVSAFLGSLLVPVESTAQSTRIATAPVSDEARLEFVTDLTPAKLGTDRQGNFWSWDRGSSTVELFNREGDLVWRLEVPGLRSLAVDRLWGVVGTATDGSALELVSLDGTSKTIRLKNDAAHVAWIDRKTVAISTTQAAQSIEIWDIDREFLIRSFGPAEEIVPRIGAVLLRSVVLQYSSSRNMLLALDSVNGTFQSWTLDGALARSDLVPAHRREEIEEWLAQADRKSKARGQRHTPFYEILRLAEDADGSAWVVESCSPDRDQASLVKISDGPPESLGIDLPKPCCSNNFTIWNHYFVSVLGAGPESTGCAVWRKLP